MHCEFTAESNCSQGLTAQNANAEMVTFNRRTEQPQTKMYVNNLVISLDFGCRPVWNWETSQEEDKS